MSFENQYLEASAKRKERTVEDGIKDIEAFLKVTTLGSREEGMPIDEKGRIDMKSFEGIYSKKEIESDEKEIAELKKKWFGDLPEKTESGGDDFERLKTVIFQKNLGSEFITVRSSPYDDIKNGVDNVILDRRAGNIVCALDEVGDIKGERFLEKRAKILERNIKSGGTRLKYGVVPEERKKEKDIGKEKIEFKFEEINNLPIFYLALPESFIQKGIKDFDQISVKEYEKNLFKLFIETIKLQIKELKLLGNKINPELRGRLKKFEDSLSGF